VDKDGDQILHEEQANRDQEQKEDKLPSKRARRLPTTRHNDFLWLDINNESINVRDTKTSSTVLHQNGRGLINRSEMSFMSWG